MAKTVSKITNRQLFKALSNTTFRDVLLEMGLPGGVTIDDVNFETYYVRLNLSSGQEILLNVIDIK